MTSKHNTKSKHASSMSMPLIPRTFGGVFVNIDVFGHELALSEIADYFRVRVSNVGGSLQELLSFRVSFSSLLGGDLASAQPEYFNWVYRFEPVAGTFISLMIFSKLRPLSTISTKEI